MKACGLLFFIFFISHFVVPAQSFTEYVNPFTGTDGHGHTFPGATMPFGMVQLSPDTRADGSWDGCSGYHYSDSILYGFSHTHLSGTGCSDYGDILIRPFSVSDHEYYSDQLFNTLPVFKHQNEKAEPGYYAVKLNNGILCELTTTKRSGIHQYSFQKNDVPGFLIDLQHRDEVISSYFKITGDKTFEGKRISKSWANNQVVFFTGEFSEAVDWDIFINNKNVAEQVLKGSLFNGKNLKAVARIQDTSQKQILLKVALSQVSAEGAKKNLIAESKQDDFEYYRKQAKNEWNKELSKIELKDKNKSRYGIFYTALYHSMIHPSLASDVDGSYFGRDFKIHQAKNFDYYTVFSLWDTYRSLHPLLTLIDKKRCLDFIKTFLAQFEQGGRLPVWELSSNETDCMIGYHSVSVLADALKKGIDDVDLESVYQAMKYSAMEDRSGLLAYKQNKMITIDDDAESVSKTVEYAYDDWCIAQVAKLLNHDSDYVYFMERSQSWKNLFDPDSKLFRARQNASFVIPFDPTQVNNQYTEANAWQYSFYVPHDIPQLIEKHGGKRQFEQKLDELFTASSKTTGRHQADITGTIGQYAHGNEPSQHIAYLYNYTDNHSKTVNYIDSICNRFYNNSPQGLIGNDDCGQMSAWYVFSSIGFYPVCPGSNNYAIGKPQYSSITIHLSNGKKFDIQRHDKVHSNKNYSFLLNKSPLHSFFIDHKEIMNGGQIEFLPSLKPQHIETNSKESKPVNLLITPTIQANQNVFADSTLIQIKSLEEKGTLYWSCDDSIHFMKYEKPFYVSKTSIIRAYVEYENTRSGVAKGIYYKRPNSWKINYITNYNSQYTAGGELGLIDGIRGAINWKKGNWQGYQPENLEVIIEFEEEKDIHHVFASCLQDINSWIFFPLSMEVYTSSNGITFKPAANYEFEEVDSNDIEIKELGGEITTFNKKVRFLKIKLENYGKLPEWHKGFGGDGFIFIDELLID